MRNERCDASRHLRLDGEMRVDLFFSTFELTSPQGRPDQRVMMPAGPKACGGLVKQRKKGKG